MSVRPVLEPLDDIARRCFEAEVELKRKETAAEKSDEQTQMGCLTAFGGGGVGWALAAGLGANAEQGFLIVVLSGVAAWSILKLSRDPDPFGRHVSKRLRAFRASDPETVLQVHRFAVKHFRQRIQSHRARTLGSDSEWGKARTSLAEALDEARQSEAYWRLRSQQADEKDFARRQREVAARLERKLRQALGKLDSRADVLLQFYSDCDARLAVMDRCNQDRIETRRLENLSDRADMVIAEAEGTLAAIGRQFLQEAQLVGRALAGLADVQVLSLAGDAPLDDMEVLADRIIERSESDKRAIRALDASLGAD